MPPTADGPAPNAGGQLIRLGSAVTVVGILLALVAMLPLVSAVRLPGYFWGLAMLTGAGFALVLAGLARNARARGRAQREAMATAALGVDAASWEGSGPGSRP